MIRLTRCTQPWQDYPAPSGCPTPSHERWKIEPRYQQMKEELGGEHFEGRSWRGFHHHATLVMLAFGFLALEQRRAKTKAPPKRSRPPRRA